MAPLSPAQQDVVDQLGAAADQRPTFDAELRVNLRATFEEELAPLAAQLDEPLHVSKHGLGQVHGCESRYLAELDEDFVVSIPVARGTVAHKAIELSVHWRGDPVALDLVDEAIARLTETEHWLATWLQQASEADLAELRSEANAHVAAFLDCWPPLKARWTPVTESALRLDVCDGKIVYRGKVDLSLGRPKGTTAGKVIVDFKTGNIGLNHREDLRFYALLESIRIGTPPRLLATYYLDQGRFHPEDVTEGLLEAAMARAIDGTMKMADLQRGDRDPVKHPSPGCRWCPIREDCAEGQAELARADEFG